MQIGIDVGATKIESVVLEDNGNETHRSRVDCPKDYNQILKTLKEINDSLEKKPFQQDLRKLLNKEVFCENDANCFALSEAIDGAAKHYKVVYGIILGSGAGGGLVVDRKIVSGPNGVAGEWGHNQLPFLAAKKEGLDSKI